jgi:hypothetical protein
VDFHVGNVVTGEYLSDVFLYTYAITMKKSTLNFADNIIYQLTFCGGHIKNYSYSKRRVLKRLKTSIGSSFDLDLSMQTNKAQTRSFT